MLSALVGDPVFERVARSAVHAVMARRSDIGLVGGHINVVTGKWTHVDGGIGSFFDSYVDGVCHAPPLSSLTSSPRGCRFYEYLAKAGLGG
mgnify:FL=1